MTMRDVVLVTVDSVRRDAVDAAPFLSSHDVQTGVTGAHFTRPSLSSLLSSSYRAAVTSRVQPPTVADAFGEAGYTCLGFAPTPNTHAQFGFDSGFDTYDTFVEPGMGGHGIRQSLARFDLLRRIYYKVKSPQAKSENRPADSEVVDAAIEAFNGADPPRFLWVHLMGTHRPYGRGEDAVSTGLDQKAFFKPGKLTDDERDRIHSKYRAAVGRADDEVERLFAEIDADPVYAITSDHGEAFGEDGWYFHQGRRRSVADYLTEVPVAFGGVSVEGPMSLLDLPPTLATAVDVDPPAAWHGRALQTERAEYAITVAPWHDTATLGWTDFQRKLVARDADVSFVEGESESQVERSDVDAEIEDQLRDLGYMDAG